MDFIGHLKYLYPFETLVLSVYPQNIHFVLPAKTPSSPVHIGFVRSFLLFCTHSHNVLSIIDSCVPSTQIHLSFGTGWLCLLL